MSGIKWIQLFFILLLGVDKTHLKDPVDLYRRSGDTVNLRCYKRLPDDPGCKSTTWRYEDKEDSQWLYEEQEDSQLLYEDTEDSPSAIVAENGLIQMSNLTPSKADRMKLESNCSLTVKHITAEDVGRYTCQRSGKKKHQFHLSVLNITRGNNGTEQTLTCSLFEHGDSCATLSWLNKDGTLIKENFKSECSTTLTINNNLMKFGRCQVTVGKIVKTFIDFPGDTTQHTPAQDQKKSYVTITVVIVVVVVVVVMATALVICFIVKRKNTPTHDIPLTSTNQSTTTASCAGPSTNQINPDDSLTYASVVHTNQTRAAVGGAKTHDDDDDGDDDEDKVTYSTVKSCSSNDLYAKVNKTAKK